MTLLLLIGLTACGKDDTADSTGIDTTTADSEGADDELIDENYISSETASDDEINFEKLQAQNPEIFAWIYIPDTGIDYPLLQSGVSDDYYQTHLMDGTEGEQGALYIEMPNMANLCDFNTIIHGKDIKEDDLFTELHQFEDAEYFQNHDTLYIYLPDKKLTYTIYAAYYDESSDILRRYDYTTAAGCQEYLDKFYSIREMGMNKRNGWDDLTTGHFLLTLDGSVNAETNQQYVVMAALVEDPSGTMDRTFMGDYYGQ